MVRFRLDLRRLVATKSVVAAGCAAVASGVWANWGTGWALIASGTLAITYALLLIDVDQEDAT